MPGAADAPVTVVEFTDYQCPYCRRFTQTTFPLLKRDCIDTGKVRWVVRDLPLAFHPNARKAGQSVHCANERGITNMETSGAVTMPRQRRCDRKHLVCAE